MSAWSRRALLRLLPPLLVSGAVWGCYVYVPLRAVEAPVGSHVEAELTPYGSDTLARYLGPGVNTLRGDIVTAEGSSFVLSVTSVEDRSGRVTSWSREQVQVPRAVIGTLQRRRFSLGRSLILGAAVVGGSLATWQFVRGGFSVGSQSSGSGGGGSH
ncbi:MAG TPA: hypothetical protein VM716_10405 [Gemmatimonadales bacterium]|nr:hypothetical protein [Gemmatimonadales bacterium]